MLVEDFKKLGMNRYEAEVYTTLVGLGEATAREISENCSVPRTKVYDTLKKLADKGFVEVQPGNPTHYRATDPKVAIEKIKSDVLIAARRCVEHLESLKINYRSVGQPIWIVRGEWAVLTKVKKLLSLTKSKAVVEFIRFDLVKKIERELYRCVERGVDIISIYWNFNGELKYRIPKWFNLKVVDPYNLPEALKEDSYVKYRLRVHTRLKREKSYEPNAVISIDESYNIKIFKEAGEFVAVVSTFPMTAIWHHCSVETIWSRM